MNTLLQKWQNMNFTQRQTFLMQIDHTISFGPLFNRQVSDETMIRLITFILRELEKR